MPYAEITIGAVILLLLGAVVFAFYKWGGAKAGAARDEAQASLDEERKVGHAVDEARRHPVSADDLGLRDKRSGPPPS